MEAEPLYRPWAGEFPLDKRGEQKDNEDKTYVFRIRFACGRDDIRHDEECGCQLMRDNVIAGDSEVAREMALALAKEYGGELIGTVRPEES